jgi:hypothetical protein
MEGSNATIECYCKRDLGIAKMTRGKGKHRKKKKKKRGDTRGIKRVETNKAKPRKEK